MAAIDRVQLLSDVKLYLPDENVLSDDILNNIIDSVIANQIPADDDQYYGEALCKSLRAAALLNKSKYSVDGANIKREEIGEVEIERFDRGNQSIWDDYIASLVDLCPIFGYTGLSSTIGMVINSGTTPVVEDCCKTSKLML